MQWERPGSNPYSRSRERTGGHEGDRKDCTDWKNGTDKYALPSVKEIAMGSCSATGGSAQGSAMTRRGVRDDWEGDPRGRAYMQTYSQFTSLYSRSQHNVVKQLYSDNKI